MGFKKLLSPLQVGRVRFRNRIVKPGQSMKFAEKDGFASQRTLDFYEALARGGVGMLVVENSCVEDVGGQGPYSLRVDDDKFLPSLSKLSEVIHKHDCPTFLQLGHSGPAHRREYSGLPPVAASALSSDEQPAAGLEFARELTVAEIAETASNYARAAERARKAGFDGVEIHAAHGYLLNSFLSCIWNKRQDDYGCQNLENRARFVVEIIKSIKERVGSDFPVGIRINGQEWGREKGTTSEETQVFGRLFQTAGADYIHVTGFGYAPSPYVQVKYPEQLLYPEPRVPLAKKVRRPGALVPLAAAIKKVVKVPVITVGRLDPKFGEWILQENMADLIAFGRRLLADPELPNKVAQGRLEDIAPCTACLECLERLERGEPARCRINAALGREGEYAIKPAVKKKRIMVVGGGPSGMEAARVAALRGHEVTLYEKEPKLGGLLSTAALIKGLEVEDLMGLIKYFRTQLAKSGVRVKLGKEVNAALVEAIKPDVVVLATGGVPIVSEIPGVNKPNVLTTADLKRKSQLLLRWLGPRWLRWLTKFWLPIGKRVVVVGGLIQGCETAEFLVKRGRKVTIVEPSEKLGEGIPGALKSSLFPWFNEKGVNILTGAKVEEITDKGVTVTAKAGQRQTIEADTVLIAPPFRANTELLNSFKGKVSEVYAIGDCREPHLILEAVADGARVGHSL